MPLGRKYFKIPWREGKTILETYRHYSSTIWLMINMIFETFKYLPCCTFIKREFIQYSGFKRTEVWVWILTLSLLGCDLGKSLNFPACLFGICKIVIKALILTFLQGSQRRVINITLFENLFILANFKVLYLYHTTYYGLLWGAGDWSHIGPLSSRERDSELPEDRKAERLHGNLVSPVSIRTYSWRPQFRLYKRSLLYEVGTIKTSVTIFGL